MTGLKYQIATLPEEDLTTTTSSVITDKHISYDSSFQELNQSYSNLPYLCVAPTTHPGITFPNRAQYRAIQYYRVFQKARTLSSSTSPVTPVLFQVEEQEQQFRQSEIATTSTLLETTSKEDTDEDFREHRGVLCIKRERKVIFSEEVEIETSKLPRWKPRITIDRRMMEVEDD